MAFITYVDHDGSQHKVEVPNEESVMRGAVNSSIHGIVAECGGGLACATCHCYVDEAWIERVGEPSQIELEMLETVASERRTNSRLSCQIIVTDALDGLVVYVPDSQF